MTLQEGPNQHHHDHDAVPTLKTGEQQTGAMGSLGNWAKEKWGGAAAGILLLGTSAVNAQDADPQTCNPDLSQEATVSTTLTADDLSGGNITSIFNVADIQNIRAQWSNIKELLKGKSLVIDVAACGDGEHQGKFPYGDMIQLIEEAKKKGVTLDFAGRSSMGDILLQLGELTKSVQGKDAQMAELQQQIQRGDFLQRYREHHPHQNHFLFRLFVRLQKESFY